MEDVMVIIDGINHVAKFNVDMIDGLVCACVMKYYGSHQAREHVTIIAADVDWDCFDDYTMGPTYANSSLADVHNQEDLNRYIEHTVDDEPFQNPQRYLSEFNYTTIEVGGWERINTETDLLTFDNLDFIKGIKKGLGWFNRPTSIEILDTTTFTIVDDTFGTEGLNPSN